MQDLFGRGKGRTGTPSFMRCLALKGRRLQYFGKSNFHIMEWLNDVSLMSLLSLRYYFSNLNFVTFVISIAQFFKRQANVYNCICVYVCFCIIVCFYPHKYILWFVTILMAFFWWLRLLFFGWCHVVNIYFRFIKQVNFIQKRNFCIKKGNTNKIIRATN